MKKGTKILIGGLILVGVISAVGGNGKDKEAKVEKENKVAQEEVVEKPATQPVTPKVTQPVIEDKEINYTYEDGLTDIQQVIEAKLPNGTVTFDEESKTYFIQVKTCEASDMDAIAYSIQTGQISKEQVKERINWEYLETSGQDCSSAILQGLKDQGLNDVHVSIMICDTTGDIVYLGIMDGVTVYDAFDDLN